MNKPKKRKIPKRISSNIESHEKISGAMGYNQAISDYEKYLSAQHDNSAFINCIKAWDKFDDMWWGREHTTGEAMEQLELARALTKEIFKVRRLDG